MTTSFADSLLASLDVARGVPGILGLRNNRLIIRKRIWSGRPGSEDATSTVEETEITSASGMPFQLEHLNEKDIALSGGRYQAGTIKIAPITPPYYGCGYSLETFEPSDENIEMFFVVKDAATGGETVCKKTAFHNEHPLHWELYIAPCGTTT